MPKFKFGSGGLRRGFAIAKLVKPKAKDFVLKFYGGTLSIISYDARKYARAEVKALESDVKPDYVSDEYFLSEDRKGLLDSDLDDVSISITDKGMNVRAFAQEKERKALIRKRPENSRRPFVPRRLEVSGEPLSLKASVLEDLLRHLSCSALVKETKTEDDMRVNQVHFYKDHECAVSNARSHATVVKYSGLNLDSSIVSSDIPLIKGFCAKMEENGEVLFGQDKTHIYVQDPKTGSCIFCARVNGRRPEFSFTGLEEDDFGTEINVDGEELHTAVAWAVTAVEGTSRITFATGHMDEGKERPGIILSADGEGVCKFPASPQRGSLAADFHIGCMSEISPYLTYGEAKLRYGHKDNQTLLDISMVSRATKVGVRHFVRSMKERV
jgi:hypothetical protein